MLATLQDTFVPLGFTRKAGAALSKTLTALAIDVASFQNAQDMDVIRDFQSAIVGNHETVRKYGIIITEATLLQEAYALGITETKRELTAQEKVQARLSLIQKGTTDAQGDAVRTANSYANVQKRLNAIQEDTLSILGERSIPTMTALKIGHDWPYNDVPATLSQYQPAKNWQANRREFNTLATAITNANTPAETKKTLMGEMQTKYGDYLGNINLETAGYDDLKKSIKQSQCRV